MAGMRGRLQRLGYRRARALLIVTGLLVLGLLAFLTYARRVEPVEVTATLLFIPVFVAMVLLGVRGGLLAGALASIAYALLRLPAIDAVGASRFAGLIAARSMAFLAFGGIGGWAAGALESSILKLDLYDHIDDATGLHNARFFVHETDLEASRAKRYETLFSVSVVDVPTDALAGGGRRGKRALRELGRALGSGIRTVDRAVHAEDDKRHRFAVILPQTGREGAQVFTGRLAEQLAARLGERGAGVSASDLSRSVFTVPGDEESLNGLRGEFAALDSAEHPERPVPATP